MSIATTWGTTEEERRQALPCDKHMERPDAVWHRGVTVNAPASLVFRWLCQLRVAPYSYDLLDNLGRQSPRELTPGLDELVAGEITLMGRWRFELLDFERDRHVTVRHRTSVFGATLLTYMTVPQAEDRCRLLVKVMMDYPRGPIGWIMQVFLPWGDLIMMRRQLLNFKELAERDAQRKGAKTNVS